MKINLTLRNKRILQCTIVSPEKYIQHVEEVYKTTKQKQAPKSKKDKRTPNTTLKKNIHQPEESPLITNTQKHWDLPRDKVEEDEMEINSSPDEICNYECKWYKIHLQQLHNPQIRQ